MTEQEVKQLIVDCVDISIEREYGVLCVSLLIDGDTFASELIDISEGAIK